jgi:hypothetical protein
MMKFIWILEYQYIMDILKYTLMEVSMLIRLDFSVSIDSIIINIDTSIIGWGVIIHQVQ